MATLIAAMTTLIVAMTATVLATAITPPHASLFDHDLDALDRISLQQAHADAALLLVQGRTGERLREDHRRADVAASRRRMERLRDAADRGLRDRSRRHMRRSRSDAHRRDDRRDEPTRGPTTDRGARRPAWRNFGIHRDFPFVNTNPRGTLLRN